MKTLDERDWREAGGQMAERIRVQDWSRTPLGPREDWVSAHREAVKICLAAAHPVLLALGPELVVIYNDAFASRLGSDALGRSARELGAADGLEHVRAAARAGWCGDLFGSGTACSLTPLRDDAGAIVGVLAFGTTARPFLEQDPFRAAFDHVSLGMVVTDVEGRIVDHNRAFAAMSASDGDLRGRPFSAFVPPAHHAEARALEAQLAAGRLACGDVERPQLRQDGSWFWASVSTCVVADGAARFVSLVRDVTERKAADAERRALLERETTLRAAAEDADRRKDEFLAILAHELKNPLAPIALAVQLLKRKVDGTDRRHLEIVERQAKNLSRIVEDVLDVSRMTRGMLELRFEPIALGDVLDRALEAVRPVVDGRRHHLNVARPEAPVIAPVDPLRLEQILVNLVANAAKYTEPGGHIDVSLERDGARAVFRVQDDGMGIPEDLRPRIFELFEQGGRERGRAQGGLGIGLTVVRRLVEMHGGTVDVASGGTGKGSTFTVSLPLAP